VLLGKLNYQRRQVDNFVLLFVHSIDDAAYTSVVVGWKHYSASKHVSKVNIVVTSVGKDVFNCGRKRHLCQSYPRV